MKKLISFLVILIVFVTYIPCVFADEASTAVTATSVCGKQGETVCISIDIPTTSDCGVISVDGIYDSAIIISDIQFSENFSKWSITPNPRYEVDGSDTQCGCAMNLFYAYGETVTGRLVNIYCTIPIEAAKQTYSIEFTVNMTNITYSTSTYTCTSTITVTDYISSPTATPTLLPPTPSPTPSPTPETVVIAPPSVNVASGQLAYGTEVTISGISFGYSLNGTDYFGNNSVTIKIDKDSTLKVWSVIDAQDTDKVYDIQSATYTYTVDASTIPVPEASISVDSIEGYKGDTICIPIKITSNSGASLITLTANCANDIVIKDIVLGKGFAEEWNIISSNPSEGNFVIATNSNSDCTTIGTYALLYCTIPESATSESYTIDISLNFTNELYKSADYFTSSTITVNDYSTPAPSIRYTPTTGFITFYVSLNENSDMYYAQYDRFGALLSVKKNKKDVYALVKETGAVKLKAFMWNGNMPELEAVEVTW
ncbi:MAG: hypothetical protein ACI4DP_04090 [Candidatus Ornithomonoglobus sp.]